MKGILVIDMPESCEECCCAYYTEGISHDYCQAVGYETYIKDYGNEPSLFDKEYKGKRPNWCPLKPMPEKLPRLSPYLRRIQIVNGIQIEKPPYTEEYQKGYNACIDEILGE